MPRPKAIIIIGTSKLQVPVIHWAKELGFYVVATDKNDNMPGTDLADRFVNIAGTDIPAFLDLANDVAQEFEFLGAYAGSDFGLPTVATLSETFDLPGPGLAEVKLALDKGAAKQKWLEVGLPTPDFEVTRNLSNATLAADHFGFPVIVKPIDSSGSRGVLTVLGPEDFQNAFDHAQSFSEEVIIEKLVTGRHIDVNGLFWQGQFFPCGMGERFFSEPPLNLPLWVYQPAQISEEDENRCYTLLEQAGRSLNLDYCPVKGDFILTEKGPVILETTTRFHGEVTTVYVTPHVLNCNPIKAYFALLSGSSQAFEFLRLEKQGVAGWHALFPPPGKVKHIQLTDEMLSHNQIYDSLLRIKPGSVIKPHYDNCSVAGFLWAKADSEETLHKTLLNAMESLEIEVD